MSGRYRLAAILIDSSCGRGALPISQALRAGRAGGNTLERYGYDAGGARVRKVSGGTTTYTFFAHYEEEATNGATTAISHYSFAGLRIAVKRGSTLYHVHGDHLGSTSLTTSAAGVEGGRDYHPYGSKRVVWGTLHTDRTFTGQKEDGTGLLYYNARYCDPALGTFISPDTLVPDAGMAIDYNRFLYARGNPLRYSDPSGYASADWVAKNNWYNARGWFHNPRSRHWDIRRNSQVSNRASAIQTLRDAGIELDDPFSWPTNKLKLLASCIAKFGERLEEDFRGSLSIPRIEHINSLITGEIIWRRKATPADSKRPEGCNINEPIACAWPDGSVEWYDSFFNGALEDPYVMVVGVHEMAHKIHFDLASTRGCYQDSAHCANIFLKGNLFLLRGYALTEYAATWYVEYWAEAVGVWASKNNYPGLLVDVEKATYGDAVFDWVKEVLRP